MATIQIPSREATASAENQNTESNSQRVIAKLKLMPFGIAAICWNSFVYLWLWRWFVVPLGVMDISYWHISGLALFVSLIRLESPSNLRSTTASEMRRDIAIGAMFFTLSFCVAYFLHLAMLHAKHI